MKQKKALLMSLCLLGAIGSANALVFPLPTNGSNVVGHVQWTQARPGDNFSTIGRRYDIGYYALIEANPGLHPDALQPGAIVVIPSRFVLPDAPHKGIVINLAELRLYYYPTNTHTVVTYPIGIGREGWNTPVGTMHIIQKIVNPTWYVPESIRADRAKQGVDLPKFVLPGPDNPLGGYAMRLSHPTYLIHGTNDYTGVGRRSSSGCIRMMPEDVEALFPRVAVNTPVTVVDTAYKAGWYNGKLYLEAHLPLQEQQTAGVVNIPAMTAVVSAAAKAHPGAEINWSAAKEIANAQNSVPQIVTANNGGTQTINTNKQENGNS